MPKEKSLPNASPTAPEIASSFARICQRLATLSKEEYEGEVGRNLVKQCEALNKLLPKNSSTAKPEVDHKQNPLNNALRFSFKSSPGGKKIAWREAKQTPANAPNPIAEILSVPAPPSIYI
jgi:hypothetical protein